MSLCIAGCRLNPNPNPNLLSIQDSAMSGYMRAGMDLILENSRPQTTVAEYSSRNSIRCGNSNNTKNNEEHNTNNTVVFAITAVRGAPARIPE